MTEKVDSYEKVPVNPSEVCYRAFELMQAKQLDEAEKLLNNNLVKVDDPVAVGLFHSSLGILFKLKGEMKTAWKHYQRAEKLIPEDPALKIIIARLLLEQFAEYDSAIKKAKKVLKVIPDNPVFAHQAYVTMGLAYIGKIQKQRAIQMLKSSMIDDFAGFVTTRNIDFNLVEMLLRKGWGVDKCKLFLEKARDFAKIQNEADWVELVDRMLAAFPEEKIQNEEDAGKTSTN